MQVFYGAAIQGNQDRVRRRHIHQGIINHIKSCGFGVVSEHATGASFDETAKLLAESLGRLPPKGIERTRFVRSKMIEFVEGDIAACVFEVSVPSLGTGIEIAHAYLRPRLGLPEVPILALYERDFWPQGVSSMIRGLPPEEYPRIILHEYSTLPEAYSKLEEFLATVSCID